MKEQADMSYASSSRVIDLNKGKSHLYDQGIEW